jgi:serine protease Do
MKIKNPKDYKGLLMGLSFSLIILASALGGALADRVFVIKPLDYLYGRGVEPLSAGEYGQRILREESVVIDVVEQVSPSVVTVSVETEQRRIWEFSPFGGLSQRFEGGQERDIGSGFIVSEDGLVVTNKHVVSSDRKYKVITQDGNEHVVEQISRDPSNDIAILKIDGAGLNPIELGDSENLKVGQYVIAIGTALGEFRQTVTVGVISGLGRGITAGSVYEGYIERLDDVIQTDAAINPGNSGGPLLNSAGQVIGVNVAVASGAENIGFAIPINIVKSGLEQYQRTGQFVSRPFLGVEYQMIDQRTAILNEVPQGAYVVNVVDGSPAYISGIEQGDILTNFDGTALKDAEDGLAGVISAKNPGDRVSIEIWRNGETITTSATLSEFSQ